MVMEAIKKKDKSGNEPIQLILDSLDVIYYRRNKHLQPFVEELKQSGWISVKTRKKRKHNDGS